MKAIYLEALSLSALLSACALAVLSKSLGQVPKRENRR